MIFFIALCTTLVALRVQTYYRSLYMSYADIRALINAHASDIDQGVERYGAPYAKYLVHAILQDTEDKRLYLLFRDGKSLTGNLPAWPPEVDLKATWQDIFVAQPDGAPPLHLLVKIAAYRHRRYMLLTGYDLQRVDILRNTLLRVTISNVLFSLFMSFVISILVVWLINRYLQGINRAAGRVMGGQLHTRVPVSGANDQFDKLSANINAMLDWIVTLLGTVRDSTNAIAHDMRTPLSRHRLELRALAEDPALPEKTKEKIAAAVMRVDGIVEMFDDILSIARAESRSGAELFAPFDVAETVGDVIEFYAALVEEKSLSLAANLPAWPVKMTGDKQLVTQAVVNLLDNAIKYTPEGGHIHVTLKEADGRISPVITIIIADDGPGIPERFLDKAKERFFRVDESRNTPGTGLGLSLANAVAGLHHGALLLEDNSPGLRATLTLTSAAAE
ncbi:MAG: HAMP domain-containing histidine kinase [Alphaproteobacteria bacterium]|nr:HAMP domain-containing histidine kinase [Alphaproteobacteria bacterium]